MTLIKYSIALVFFATICNANLDLLPTQDQWIDIESIAVRHDKSIQYITRIGKILPAITLIEIRDGRLAAVLSLNSPDYFKRDKEWVNDFRIIYLVKDKSRELGILDGESFNIPNGKWVSSLTFLSPEKVLKLDVAQIVIQAKKTEERMAYINQLKVESVEKEKMTDEMMSKVPFSNNIMGDSFDFRLNLHNGDVFDTKQHRGKVILLDIWSWHCGPCRKAIPTLIELSKTYPDEKLKIIGINFDDYENIDEIINQQGNTWPQWVVKEDAMQSAIYKKLKFNGIPYYTQIPI